MTEDTNRPNANYKLSKPDTAATGEEGLVFYYSRERRLAKAPQAVRDLYAEPAKHRGFNLLRPLVADKPRAFIFFVIVILCVVILLLSVLGYFDRSYALEGNTLDISAVAYEGTAIVVVKKTVSNRKSAYSGAVDIAVSPAARLEDEEYAVFYHRIFFSLEQEEEYRFVVPYNSGDLAMVLQTEKSTVMLTFKPD